MSLTPTIASPSDLLQKLERERWRAIHHQNRKHKADHFYNFCITALAMKEHFFEWKGVAPGARREPYYDAWNRIPELSAASEIANAAKHAVLREPRSGVTKRPRTSRIRPSTSGVANVYIDEPGNVKIVNNPRAPSITVEFEGGQRFSLYQFMDTIVKYWHDYLSQHGVPLQRQQARTLYGEA